MRVSRDKRDKAKRRRNMPVQAFANKRQLRKMRLRDGGGNVKTRRPVWWIGPPFLYRDGLYGPTVNAPRL